MARVSKWSKVLDMIQINLVNAQVKWLMENAMADEIEEYIARGRCDVDAGCINRAVEYEIKVKIIGLFNLGELTRAQCKKCFDNVDVLLCNLSSLNYYGVYRFGQVFIDSVNARRGYN